ncbi:hypothetical protein SASPL_143492 [Salvia splendens]|uniref:NAC domain-containing protein n=1 Tax=Salvia splendens TaxID=180675 RepID=A0A8X8WMB4_SALSN|nr:hypothetical protein SASPL_143492 [Salvia splendens]
MMDAAAECCVPPGFRFHPTDEELVGYYLRKKVASQKIDLDVIRDIDLYRIEPWDLQEKCGIGYEEQKEWYFFSHKDKKYPSGTRTNRATMAGFWKATGRDKAETESLQFAQLPQLKSSNNIIEDEDRCSKKVTDWRDLDKFVASQLSHGDEYHGDSQMELLLRREEETPPNLLSASDHSDIGICIFNK